MTLLEKVKAAIANPNLITNEMIHEANNGYRQTLLRYSMNEDGEAEVVNPNYGEKPHLYLSDWNLIMPEIEKRYIRIQPYLDDLGGAVGWLVGAAYSLQLKHACWAAILADMVEKGEVK